MQVAADSSKIDRPAIVHHYTSQPGLLGIIRTKSLWASSILYLNDSAEWQYAIKVMQDQVIPILEARPDARLKDYCEQVLSFLTDLKKVDYFVGSFSEEPDLLSQWRAYSGEGVGFSIGFDFARLGELAVKQDFRLFRCKYDPVRQIEDINFIISKSKEKLRDEGLEKAIQYSVGALLLIGPALKDVSFREEKEWRLISKPIGPDAHVLLRPGKSMLIPYSEFSLDDEKKKTPITKVIVGPTPHMELSIASVRRLLVASGLDTVPVEPSAVPFRNW